jgi:adenosylmethionine-8-amino-7-oxononanoate aminotransferase
MTGFGRTGVLFASNYMHHKPDIICLSKGLTGGTMALGVTACTDAIYQAYLDDDLMKTFFHGHSFTANPLACTAALASLDLLEQPICMQQIAWISQQNKGFAEKLVGKKGLKNIRTIGTILAFEIDSGKDEYLNKIGATLTVKSMQNGIYLRPLGNTVYTMPPYCINYAELCSIYDNIEQLIEF